MPFLIIVFMGFYTHLMIGFLSPSKIGLLSLYYFMFLLITIVPPLSYQDFAYRPGFDSIVWGMAIHAILFFTFYCIGFAQVSSKASRYRFISQRVDFYQYKKIYNVLLFVTIAVLIHQLLSIKHIPLFGMLKGISGEQLAMDRETSFKLTDAGSRYLWNMSRQVFCPLLVLVSYFYFIYFQKTFAGFVKFIAIVMLAAFNNALSSSLAPVALLGVYILFAYFLDKGKVNVLGVFFTIFLMLFFPAMSDFLYSDNISFFESFSITMHKIYMRFSYETFERSLYYFDIFPDVRPFLEGRANRLIATITNQEWFNLQNFAFLYIVNKDAEHLANGSANAHFISYMYADFALWGIAIASIIFGYFVGLLEGFYSNMKKSVLIISCYIISIAVFWKFMGTQPTTIFISHGILLMVVLVAWFNKKYLKSSTSS